MKETTTNEQLKAALTLLAAELETSKNNERLLTKALKGIFPFSLYISMRPDVNEVFDGNSEDILNHYIQCGINEINLNKELQKIQNELKYKNEQLELLAEEISILKKELHNSRLLNKQSIVGKDIENGSNGVKHKTLLEIHLEDTTYSSDKWENYFQLYEEEFSCFRSKNKIRLLEIGVQNGGSLQCWQRYFYNDSEIVGIDIDNKTSFLEYEGSIKNYVGDATEADWLKLFSEKEKDFDIIIDDGSHVNSDIITTFTMLFEKLKPGGIYVVEDVHTSYWETFQGDLPGPASNENQSAITFFKEIIDSINYEHWIDAGDYNIEKHTPITSAQAKNNAAFRIAIRTIEAIKFSNSIIFIKKSSNGLPRLGNRIISNKEFPVNEELKWMGDF